MGKVSLRELISSEEGKARYVRCVTCRLLSELEGDDLAALSEAVTDRGISSGVVARALTGFGVTVSPSAIARHRRECGPIQ